MEILYRRMALLVSDLRREIVSICCSGRVTAYSSVTTSLLPSERPESRICDSNHCFVGSYGSILTSDMKHPHQFVAVVVVALLAIPQAVAESFCSPLHDHLTTMQCCNGDTVGSSFKTAPAVLQDCNESCCSVAPSQAPPSSIPDDKLTADTPTLDTPQTIASLIPCMPTEFVALDARDVSSSADRQVLLQTFRI